MENLINIVFNINKEYIPYFSVTISSILRNSSINNFFNFYILSTYDLSNEIKSIKIYDQVGGGEYKNYKIINKIINISNFDYKTINKILLKHITIETVLRLFIPTLFVGISRCIYLDTDIIVNTDIVKLYNYDIGEFYVAAGMGLYPINPTDVYHKYRIYFNKKYKLHNNMYFNAGVLLFNLDNIRRDNQERVLIESLDKYKNDKNIHLYEQDIINIVFNGNGKNMITTFDPRWNVCLNVINRPPKDAYIFHWASSKKPWNNIFVPHITLYIEYAMYTQSFIQIKQPLLKLIDEELGYLNKKLKYKVYKRRKAMFDYTIFGKRLFPRKLAYYQHKIDEFLIHKNKRNLQYEYLIELKKFLSKV